jgi:hypothetical protein
MHALARRLPRATVCNNRSREERRESTLGSHAEICDRTRRAIEPIAGRVDQLLRHRIEIGTVVICRGLGVWDTPAARCYSHTLSLEVEGSGGHQCGNSCWISKHRQDPKRGSHRATTSGRIGQFMRVRTTNVALDWSIARRPSGRLGNSETNFRLCIVNHRSHFSILPLPINPCFVFIHGIVRSRRKPFCRGNRSNSPDGSARTRGPRSGLGRLPGWQRFRNQALSHG